MVLVGGGVVEQRRRCIMVCLVEEKDFGGGEIRKSYVREELMGTFQKLPHQGPPDAKRPPRSTKENIRRV